MNKFDVKIQQLAHRFQRTGHQDDETCYILIQCLKEEAEKWIKVANFEQAEECYNFAIYCHSLYKGNKVLLSHEDQAVLWSNRSLVRCKQKKLPEAFEDAEKCIELHPRYVKGYWRASQAMRGMGKFSLAVEYLFRYLSLEHPSDDDFVCFMTELAVLITYFKGESEWRECEKFNIFITDSPLVWNRIIKSLFDQQEYEAIAVLTLGDCGKPQIPKTILHSMANIPGLSFKNFNVGQMLSHVINKEGLKLWHLKLSSLMLKKNANIHSIQECFSKPLLVIMTSLSLEGEMPEFLNLAWNKLTPDKYDEADNDGDTALHVWAKSKNNSKPHGIEICKDLLKHGCLVKKNAVGNIPYQYLAKSNKMFEALTEFGSTADAAICNRIDLIRISGNEALQKDNLQEAIKLYDKAIEISEIYSLKPQLSVLYSNMAAVHIKLEDYKRALLAADKSIQAMPSPKAYYRKGQSLIELGQNSKAFDTLMKGFTETTEDVYKIKFIEEAACLLVSMNEKERGSRTLKVKGADHLWPKLLQNLTQSGKWNIVYKMITGSPLFDIGPIKNNDASTVILSSIFDVLDKEYLDFDPSLLLKLLLQHGAPPASLASKDESYFHSAVRFCLATGNKLILDVILEMDLYKTVTNALDVNSQTPLHVLCQVSSNSGLDDEFVIHMARDLIKKGVNPHHLDSKQKLAINYTLSGSQLRKFLGGPKQDSSMDWNLLKENGNEAYKLEDYKKAIDLYTEAIFMLESNVQSNKTSDFLNDVDGHNLSVLFGNRAECWCKLNNKQQFLDDAKKSVEYDGNWYKSHQRVGRAFRAKNKYQHAIKAFMNTYRSLKVTDSAEVRESVLIDLAETAVDLNDQGEKYLMDLCNINVWAKISLACIRKKKYRISEFIAKKICMQNDPQSIGQLSSEVKLDVFCNKDLLNSQHLKWVLNYMVWWLFAGADYTTLKFHPGDTFFHATIAIDVLCPAPPQDKVKFKEDYHGLLFYIVEQVVQRLGLENSRDDKGNTVLHLLATLKGSDSVREFLAHFLLGIGVDVLAENNDKKLAIDLLGQNDHIRKLIQHHTNIERTQQKLQQRKEETKPQVFNKDTTHSQQQVKEETKPQIINKDTTNSVKDSTSSVHMGRERKKAEQYEHKKPVFEEKKRKHSSQNSKKRACDFCEKKLRDSSDHQQQGNHEKAFLQLVDVINSHHNEDIRHKGFRQQSIERVAALLSVISEIPTCLIKHISGDGCKDVLRTLASSHKWQLLKSLTKQFQLVRGAKPLSDFAKSISLLDVVNAREIMQNKSEAELTKIELITLFLNYGAKVQEDTSLEALEICMKNSEWKLVLLLLDIGANPKGITLNPKDTPNHAALQVALFKKPGDFTILEKLQSLYESDRKKYPYLNISCQDQDGNTLLHVAAQAKFSQHSLRAIEVLCGNHAPANVENKEGKLPVHYLSSKTDRRAQYLWNVMSEDKITTAQKPIVFPKTSEPDEPDPQTKPAKPTKKKETSTKNVQSCREEAEVLLNNLPVVNYNLLLNENKKKKEVDQHESDDDEEDEGSSEESQKDELNYEAEEIKPTEYEDESDIDVEAFDSLEWEVECTEEVWSLLRSKKKEEKSENHSSTGKSKKERLSDPMKKFIVKKIQQLASGDWKPYLLCKVKGVPSTLHLFTISLPQGGCIIWELAIAFSPRRSEIAEKLLEYESGDAGAEIAGGKIYSELIRVWNIVLKNADFPRCVHKIVSSHQRGESCIIQKSLAGLSSSVLTSSSSASRIPVLFFESERQQAVVEKTSRYFPPASSHKNEFHILKFYSFSSSLVGAILSKSDLKIDFPFRVTDLEHAIINLDSQSPLLLLGRSGTGKTTCCLYRLWAMFLCYWEQATKYNAPLLSRYLSEAGEVEDTQQAVAAIKAEKVEEAQEVKEDIGDTLDEAEDVIYEHLHQLFVTKNPVLCTEVEKNFLKLRHATNILHEHNAVPNNPLPNTLQDVDDFSYPLFLTSRQLLLMLDASIDGQPFFPRDEDLALKFPIPGWGTQEDIFNIIPLMHDFFDSSDEEDDDDPGKAKKIKTAHQPAPEVNLKAKTDLRRECTYEVFAYEIWPKVSKKTNINCHPSLVWTEIMSFIKGSYEALYTEKGYLDKNQYLDLGRKRAPNFSGDRSLVYEVFLRYDNYKQQHFLFDEADFVFRVYTRLKQMAYYPWILHEIYVDETQDFTQAELALLVSLCHDPNKMFLTGDTAQGIMRGISFRFKDLQSLFYFAKNKAKENEKYLAEIKVPQKVHQLRHNYRSHTGILSLASAVLDILMELFPESFDQLEKDQGMFAGPKPVIIESCSPEDLALLLTGNRRKTSHIEFGAHQAILVVNDEAKEHLPEELSTAVVLTIYESKGLEFDDVLIYNFFKDSQAKKEWRVVTSYLETLAANVKQQSNDQGLVEINAELLLEPSHPRPIEFNPSQHKLLNSELKQLYTALTRARVNVWIFDEDAEKRGPMFEYFKVLKLVDCIGNTESDTINDDLMFAETSSMVEWKYAGDNYMKQHLYSVAAKCYRKAELPDKEKLALAYQTALEASRLKTSPKEMRDKYLRAGNQFLKCGDLHRAALCFQNSRDYSLAALAYERNGEFEEASVQYRRVQNTLEESRCLEQIGKFNRAIRVLVEKKFFDRAIDCLHRYDILINKLKQEKKVIPAVLLESKPSDTYSEERLCYSAAEYHHELNDKSKTLAAIHRVKDKDVQINFLQKKGYLIEAAEIMRKTGDTEQAATLMLMTGETDKALEYAKDGLHKDLIGQIHLVLAFKYETHEQFDIEKLKEHANKALDVYIEQTDKNGQAMANLILGKHTADPKRINKAMKKFGAKPLNEAGKLESFAALMEIGESLATLEDCYQVLRNITLGLAVVEMLLSTKPDKSEQQRLFLHFYGMRVDSEKQQVSWHPLEYPMCGRFMDQPTDLEQNKAVTVDREEATKKVANYISVKIYSWVDKIKSQLDKLKPQYVPCRNYIEGRQCDLVDCKFTHKLITQKEEEREAFKFFSCCVQLDYCLQTGLEKLDKESRAKISLNGFTFRDAEWLSVIELLDLLLPVMHPPTRASQDYVNNLMKSLHKDCRAQVSRYFHYLWLNQGRVGKGISKSLLKEQCKSCDWIVQAAFYSKLLALKDLDVAQEVQNLEEQLMKLEKPWFKKTNKYALHPPYRTKSGEVLIETLGARFVESLEFIVSLDPYEALFTFTKMLSSLGFRGQKKLMPRLDHLVFWVEYNFTVSWYFIAHHCCGGSQPFPFIMTSNLFANVNLVNHCLDNAGHKNTIQQLISQYQPHKVKFMIKRQDHISNFLVGHNEFSKFSLINCFNEMCAQTPAQYVLAERILLLALVCLLNIPYAVINKNYEVQIRRELFKLIVTKSMPAPLAKLVSLVKQATTFKDVTVATEDFVRSQGDVSLYDCQWLGRESCPLKWQPLKIADYPQHEFIHVNLKDLAESSNVKVASVSEVMDEDDLKKLEEKKREMEAQKCAQQDQKLKLKKIIRFLKVCIMKNRLKNKLFRTFEVEELFVSFAKKSHFCGICGQELTAGGISGPEVTVGADSSTLELEDKQDEYSHYASVAHKLNETAFQKFKELYATHIHGKLDEIRRFLSEFEVEEKSDIYAAIKMDVAQVVDKLESFNKSYNQIKDDRKWLERDEVLRQFSYLNDIFVEKKLSIEDQHKKYKEDVNVEKEASSQVELSEEHQEEIKEVWGEGDNVEHNYPERPREKKWENRGRGQGANYPGRGGQGVYQNGRRISSRGRGYNNRNREEFQRDLPPRFRKQFNSS
ncbi:TPR and ankyrin repeat-containing protein 1-like isoform X2 [Physella acuta]|nr:TPR and ankyrin repeat-containing protein 1-like isoform X2 [Physella acuta]